MDRSIAGVMRSVAKKVAMNEKYNPKLSEKEVGQALGPIKFDNEQYTKIDLPGVAVGLAWTRTGGDILFIEASIRQG